MAFVHAPWWSLLMEMPQIWRACQKMELGFGVMLTPAGLCLSMRMDAVWWSWLPEIAAGLLYRIFGNGEVELVMDSTGSISAGRVSYHAEMWFQSFIHLAA